MADLDALSALYFSLAARSFKNPNGDTLADGYIASTLGVASLPYTSNDTNAQTLLPAGWSWSTTDAGNACCVRNSDGVKTDDMTADEDIVLLPNPMARCLAVA